MDIAAELAAGKLQLEPVDAATLMRITRFPKTEPFWGKRATNRFDDPDKVFGVTYAAPTLEVAFAETVLHERSHYVDTAWVVAESDITERHVVRYLPRPLRLLNLTGPHLKRLGLDNEVSAGGPPYADTMALARHVHEHVPGCDGLLYVSRQNNLGVAVALFERSTALVDNAGAVRLDLHPDLQRLLDLFGAEMLPTSNAPPGAP